MDLDAKIRAIFNAARYYCRTRYVVGHPSYSDTILGAILKEIERAEPKDFKTENEVRDYLVRVGESARILYGHGSKQHWVSYEPNYTEEDRQELEEGRANYLTYIRDLSADDAAQVPTVPYRHVLSGTKRRRVGKKLYERWDADPDRGVWHPLRLEPLPPDVLAFQLDWFWHEVGLETLRGILAQHGIIRIWEITELPFQTEYELDPLICDFRRHESYWSSLELDWLIYESHESSITTAGTWLIEAVKKVWPGWEDHLYSDYDYERPPSM